MRSFNPLDDLWNYVSKQTALVVALSFAIPALLWMFCIPWTDYFAGLRNCTAFLLLLVAVPYGLKWFFKVQADRREAQITRAMGQQPLLDSAAPRSTLGSQLGGDYYIPDNQ